MSSSVALAVESLGSRVGAFVMPPDEYWFSNVSSFGGSSAYMDEYLEE